nr:DUF4375 domain-containing protein [uncultured Flavobacterium sp.]
MSEIDDTLDENLVDFYYSNAVEGIKEEWLINIDENWYNYIYYLPEKEKVTYHIAILDEEVANGGFNQYFINGYGQFAKDTIGSLQLIKANKSALLLEKAYNFVNKEKVSDNIFRVELLSGKITGLYEFDNELNNFLSELDDEYCEYEDNIAALLVNYLKE